MQFIIIGESIIIYRKDGDCTVSKKIDFKNRDRFIQLGIAIAALRKMRGMSQEQLAEKSNVSRSHISAIEAPGMVRPFSLDVFFNIADALDVDPADLINATVFPDKILKNK
ncbi:MAG: helix-turn-helix transcriptional regulator [Ruminococcaceae bacterium]|nr:helix-turn-helix transcriptional regulator [Oscillospiraceae bacterium]